MKQTEKSADTFGQLTTMKNFYSNRHFNFIRVFTSQNKDTDYKRRFNQDIFNQRQFDPLINTRPAKSREHARTIMIESLKAKQLKEELVNSHFAWLDGDQKIRRVKQIEAA